MYVKEKNFNFHILIIWTLEISRIIIAGINLYNLISVLAVFISNNVLLAYI